GADETLGERALGALHEIAQHRGGNLVRLEEVADGDDAIASDAAMQRDDELAGEMRRSSGVVDHRELAPAVMRRRGDEGVDGLRGGLTGGEKFEAERPEARIGTVLGQHRADAGTGEDAPAADREARGGDGGAEHAGALAARGECECHDPVPPCTAKTSISIARSGLARPLTMISLSAQGTPSRWRSTAARAGARWARSVT